ncbi:ribonuclease J [Acidaminobacter sp. JC074]|uniref:ribonuclease J n=1 Tax=Acidaminobacter sp. JC074 TaxID=2530199 RepID=UPI001F111F7D|nr:ribonuclease J [Acidaminobacter sp. JC074]MCH4888787.1 ribonuclease J [Acidaminobacter sp. JC074]
MSKKLKVIPLGGLNEIGKNMTVFEYDDEIVIVDCGLSFPDDEMLGIDVVIPDFTYLKKNQHKIKGIFITHGHEDHIGAIPYFLKQFEAPIYGYKLTLGLVQLKLEEHGLMDRTTLNVVKPRDVIKTNHFSVEFIRVSHSIPDASALHIKTPYGSIVHTGDFKIDYNPIDSEMIDLNRFAELGREGVLLLLADSTNVDRKGYTMSESTVGASFDDIFHNNQDKRIFVASFASNVHRIQQVVHSCYAYNRKLAFSGRSMVNVSKLAMELGYLKVPDGMIIELNEIDKYPDNEIVIATTGSQGEPMAALSRMANSEHRQLQLRQGDLVVFSSSPIPGNEKSVKRVIDKILKLGTSVIYESLADIHVSGHAKEEELKLMHSLVKPKYFAPVHGEYTHLSHHAFLAESLGKSSSDVFIMENGHGIEIDKDGARYTKKVPSGRTLIDGLGVGDVGNIVLRDRRILSQDGLMIVVLAIEKESGKIVSGPDIISRGFVYVREAETLMSDAKSVLTHALYELEKDGVREWSSIKSTVRDTLRTFLYQETRRSPMILPIIMEV